MKLRNLMYATMIACAFASCSKDDDSINPGGGAEANATLDIKLDRAETKALPGGVVNEENKINTLSLLVFNGIGDAAILEVIGTAKGEGDLSVKTPLKPGNKTVIVLANLDVAKTSPAIAVNMTYGALKSAVVTFADGEYEGGLTMNSKTYEVTVVASKTNYMGYGSGAELNNDLKTTVTGATDVVKLYRNVAKVLLNTVKVNTAINGNQYPDAKVSLKEVFILHGHTKTNVIGAGGAEWGAINQTGAYLNGYANDIYKDTWVKYMEAPVNGVAKEWVYPYITDAAIAYAREASYPQALSGAFFTYNSATPNLLPFYVYENTEANTTAANYTTLLVVKADFTYRNVAGEEITEAGRYYPLSVGYAGTNDFTNVPFSTLRTGALSGVLRNLQYNVNLTISGPGYETPFGPKPEGPDGPGPGGDTFLDAQVEVVEFGVVSQSGDVE